MILFDGKQSAADALQSLAEKSTQLLSQYGRRPCLNVVIAGDDYGSMRYVASCEKNAIKAGIDCKVIRLPQTVSEIELIDRIRQLNEDMTVDGILVQMPLPQGVDANKVIQAVSPDKDVDGITDTNTARLWKSRKNDYSRFCVPCTPRSVMRILKETIVELDGKQAVVIGRSNIVGLPVSKLLMNENATVTVAHSHTQNLPALLRQADIIVAAVGKARFVTADMVKKGAVVIDVGINQDPMTGKMCGDVDTERVAPLCSVITPVPGGVGLLTICSLLENTLDCFLRQQH